METSPQSFIPLNRSILAASLGFFLVFVPAAPAIVYVDINAGGTGNGGSWQNAYTSIQAAIDDPRSATEAVWIAKGSYQETLVLTSGRQLYGGFPPGATSFTQRDPATNFTNLDLRLTSAPNHGLTLANVQNVVVDGIRVLSGNADGPDAQSGSGGGMYCDAADDTNRVEDCTFSDNNAAADGGAVVCLNGASPRFLNCTFATNTAAGGKGGAVYCAPGSLAHFEGCTFDGNQAHGGGGVYGEQASLTVVESTFSRNLSGNGGGGFHFDHTSGTLTGCAFVANQDNAGAGIFADNGSTPVFAACDFYYNQAVGGGAIFTQQGAEPQFNDCRIEGNTSASDGGAIYCVGDGSVKMNRCVISGNQPTAGRGSALYLFNNINVIPTFTNCVISGNYTSEEAAIFAALTRGDFQNCTVSNNAAGAVTGGISCAAQADLHFTNCIFTNNQDHAFAIESTSGYPTLDTCLFQNNTGGDVVETFGGGAVYSGDAINTSFPVGKAQGNFAGDPKFVMNGAKGIHGTWTATATYDTGTDLTTYFDSATSFTPHAFVGRRITVTARSFEFRVVDNGKTTVMIQGDHSRVGAGNPYRIIDYHIENNSEALDRGKTGNAPAVDLDGAPRPVDLFGVGFDGPGQGYDVGAYEYQVVGVTVSPAVIDFATVVANGGTAVRTITLKNTGTASVDFSSQIEDDTEGNFALQPSAPAGPLGPGASREWTVSFSPLSVGEKSGTVTILSDGFPSIVKAYLSGTGVAPVRLWLLF